MTSSMATADLQVSNRPFESNRDTSSPNRNLTPVTTSVGPTGALEVGGCGLSDLARRYGTPLYVLDEATLRGTARPTARLWPRTTPARPWRSMPQRPTAAWQSPPSLLRRALASMRSPLVSS